MVRDDTTELEIPKSSRIKVIAPDGSDEANVEFDTVRIPMKDINVFRP
jgi:hypothetical protein